MQEVLCLQVQCSACGNWVIQLLGPNRRYEIGPAQSPDLAECKRCKVKLTLANVHIIAKRIVV